MLLLAHGALVMLFVLDRVEARRATATRGTPLTLWVATMAPPRRPAPAATPAPSRRPEATRQPKAAPLPPRESETEPALTIVAPPAPVAAPAPAPPAPPDPRLTGNFAEDAPPARVGGAAPATGDAASGPLRLQLGADFFAQEREREKHLTPAQEAMRDPRSNHLELSPHEKRMIAFGEVECIAWQREPDGSIYRGPGHWRRVTPAQPGTHEVRECVR